LSKTGQVSLASSLVFGGLFNILTGLWYDVPLCVQPMKAIAAMAIASNMNAAEISSAGMFVSACLLFLGLSGLVRVVNQYIPLCIVRGIQAATGYTLVINGISNILASSGFHIHDGLSGLDNFPIAFVCFLLAMVCYNSKRNYSALFIFGLGFILSLVKIHLKQVVLGPVGVFFSSPSVPSPSEFGQGVLKAGLGQLPLTLLNSVIAVSLLAEDLFPERPVPVVSVTSVSISVGLMNLVGCWFGSMPFCHGSGGLAGQYRFGARSGTSLLLLGTLKIISGLFFSSPLLDIFQNLPTCVLGVMLCIAGLELASTQKDLAFKYPDPERLQKATLAFLVTCGTILGFKNDGIGFLVGCLTWLLIGGHQPLKPDLIA
jgi:MFS superfamily sulfate permease-like transporter